MESPEFPRYLIFPKRSKDETMAKIRVATLASALRELRQQVKIVPFETDSSEERISLQSQRTIDGDKWGVSPVETWSKHLLRKINISEAWKKPIYFAVTVSDDNLMGLGPYLKMQGLVYRVLPKKVLENDRLDLARTLHLLDNVYRYRGLGDGTARLNDTSEKLLSNYAASYIQIALSMRRPLSMMKSDVERLKGILAADLRGQI